MSYFETRNTPTDSRGERLPFGGTRFSQWVSVSLLLVVLALGFKGARGIADPDEGFYTNVAVGMVESGDWWLPKLNGEIFLDKPPLLYWGVSLGIKVFGQNEWAARVVQGLWFLGTAMLVGLLAREFWGEEYGPPGALFCGLMLGPVVAGDVLTPDAVLCFWTTLAVFAYWKSRGRGESPGSAWWSVLLGVALGFGMLAKGPAILLIALPIGVHAILTRGWRSLVRPESLMVVGIAIAISGSWYLSIGSRIDGALSYWFDNQIAGRLWSSTYNRSPKWWGSLAVYVPALLIGSLPWTPMLIFRGSRRLFRGRHESGWLREPATLLVLLWATLPMAVLLVARSRLPLYLLPVLPALALAAVRLGRPKDGFRSVSRVALVALGIWVVLILGVRLGTGIWPISKDTETVARGLAAAGVSKTTPVVVVDVKLNGLRFYGHDLTNARYWAPDYPYFRRWPTLDSVLRADRRTSRLAVVTKTGSTVGVVHDLLSEHSFACVERPLTPRRLLLDCQPPQ